MNLIDKPKAFTWLFPSKSKPSDPPHETHQYLDGTVSCGCNGWTRHVASDGSRSCRHTRLVDTKEADNYCLSKIDHLKTKVKPKPIKLPPAPVAEEQVETVKPTKVARKIQW
jgi:hypothetical protein